MRVMDGIHVADKPVETVDDRIKLSDAFQVVLFNDDHNEAGYVVRCLMTVFGHPTPLATKIMFEAHSKGRAIAEMESGENAQLHKDQLQSFGLTAAVEKI